MHNNFRNRLNQISLVAYQKSPYLQPSLVQFPSTNLLQAQKYLDVLMKNELFITRTRIIPHGI